MLLGCIADDFTGASDLANTLAKGGMAVTQFVGIPSVSSDCEAGVVSLKSRTIPADEAVRQSLLSLDWLLAQGCRQILFKYCSTFDSTPAGNIGPVAEALLDRLGGHAVVCPVFPETGRTLYQGHLFVNGVLLSETGMRDHPLTPMTDPDIRRWLRQQTKGDVGLVPYPTVRQGTPAIRQALAAEAQAGRRLIVTDAVEDADLRSIGEAIADNCLVTGGSGIALGLPDNFRKAGLLSDRGSSFAGSPGPCVALSGSCSQQSLRQVEEHGRHHPTFALSPGSIMAGETTVPMVLDWLEGHRDTVPLVFSTASTETVRAAQATFGREAIASRIERFMADLAHAVVAAGVTRVVVGGGETSGAVVTALDARAFAIGPEIDPGVPALAIEGSPVRMALKSGNFGTDDFYAKAAKALSRHA